MLPRPAPFRVVRCQFGCHPPDLITLGQIAGGLISRDMARNRRDRRGHLRTARLMVTHDSDLPIPELRRSVAADCPCMKTRR